MCWTNPPLACMPAITSNCWMCSKSFVAAGIHGGRVVASGTLAELAKHPESVTGQSLRAEKKFPARGERRSILVAADVRRLKSKSGKGQSLLTSAATNEWLTLHNAAVNNL